MKKVQKIFLLALIIICCGCMNSNIDMNIKKDKSMNLEIVYEDDNRENIEKYFPNNTINNLTSSGYQVEKYTSNNSNGIKIILNLDNIDKVSADSEITCDFIKNLSYNIDSARFFQVKKYIIFNIYEAKLKIDSNRIPDFTMPEDDSDSMRFNVTLPYPALADNATFSSNGKKTLSWELNKVIDKENIYFKFIIFDKTRLLLFVGILILLIIFIYAGRESQKRYADGIDTYKNDKTKKVNSQNNLISPEPVIPDIVPKNINNNTNEVDSNLSLGINPNSNFIDENNEDNDLNNFFNNK